MNTTHGCRLYILSILALWVLGIKNLAYRSSSRPAVQLTLQVVSISTSNTIRTTSVHWSKYYVWLLPVELIEQPVTTMLPAFLWLDLGTPDKNTVFGEV